MILAVEDLNGSCPEWLFSSPAAPSPMLMISRRPACQVSDFPECPLHREMDGEVRSRGV